MIKVLHVLPDFYSAGGQHLVMHLLRNTDRSRFEPAALSLFGPSGYPIETALQQDGFSITYLGKKLGLDIGTLGKLAGAIRALKPQVIHTHMGALRYALPALAFRGRDVLAVHTVHNLAQYELEDELRFVRPMHGFAFKHMRVVPVAIATSVRESIAHMYGVEAPLIPNGIPISHYWRSTETGRRWRTENRVGQNDIIFACVGRLNPQKNHRLLLNALARVVPKAPSIRCLIVGDGGLESELREQTAALSLEDRVSFLGMRSDIPEILAAADASVLSSDWEGNPLAVMEAMAAGKPIVATSVGGVPELVPEGAGLLVPPKDVEALAQAMYQLASDPGLRIRMGSAAFEYAQREFSAAMMTRRYESLYVAELEENAHSAARIATEKCDCHRAAKGG